MMSLNRFCVLLLWVITGTALSACGDDQGGERQTFEQPDAGAHDSGENDDAAQPDPDTEEDPDGSVDPTEFDRGDLTFDVTTSDQAEAGHTYLYRLYGGAGMAATIHVESEEGFEGSVTLSNEAGEELGSAHVNNVSASATIEYAFASDGFYLVKVEVDTDGRYGITPVCESGCESTYGVCPELPSVAPPPAGSRLALLRDQEFLVVDADAPSAPLLDVYSGTFGFESTNPLPSSVQDLTFYGGEGAAVERGAVLSGNQVHIVSPEAVESFTLTRPAVAIANINLWADGIQDLVAVDASGAFEVLTFRGDEPELFDLTFDFGPSGEAVDLAGGDVDADGARELIFIYKVGDAHRLVIVQIDEDTATADTYNIDGEFSHCTAGDLDNDLRAEIVCSHTGFFGADNLSVFRITEAEQLQTVLEPTDTPGSDIVDLVIGTTAHTDQEQALFVLDDSNSVRRYDWTGSSFSEVANHDVFGSPTHIALADADGNSPTLSLRDGPYTTQTDMTPNLVLVVPPVWRGSSDYWTTAGVEVDQTQTTREEYEVGINAALTMGYSQGIPNVAGAGVQATLSTALTRNVREFSQVRQSLQFAVISRLGRETAGGALLTWTCYDSYAYDLSDKGRLLSDSEQQIVTLNVPRYVGRALWSIERYNAWARDGGSPELAPGVRSGHPETYPTQYEDVYGNPIESDWLVVDPEVFIAPDTTRLMGLFEISSAVEDVDKLEMGYSVTAKAMAGGYEVQGAVGVTGSTTHALRVGELTRFSYGLGPVLDDPETPLDEYDRYAYQFSPFLYRHESGPFPFYALYHSVLSTGPGYVDQE